MAVPGYKAEKYEDKRVNVRRENPGCPPRVSGQTTRALGESLNTTLESDVVETLRH